MSNLFLLLQKLSSYDGIIISFQYLMFNTIKIWFWIIILTFLIFSWQYSNYKNEILFTEETSFTVKKNTTFSHILSEKTKKPFFTKLYLRNNPPSFELQAGEYMIPSWSNIQQFIANLEKPQYEWDIFLTFLEWWNIFDIDAFLTSKWLIWASDFISYAENHSLESEYPFLKNISSLEGYLYPDTYAVNPRSFQVEWLARKMLSNFEKKISPQTSLSWEIEDGSFHEIITLASIVEKEERNTSERPIVAGILKKRLNEGWKIWADITVCYAHRLTSQECKLSVTKYLYDKNEYNTRQKTGLPAGPIGNPSLSSIEAVISPKQSPYYYYLHDTLTGQIYYARTNAEHEHNKSLYLR